MLVRNDSELTDHMNKQIPTHCTLAAWKRTQFSPIRGSFPGITKKGIQTNAENSLTMELIWAYLPLWHLDPRLHRRLSGRRNTQWNWMDSLESEGGTTDPAGHPCRKILHKLQSWSPCLEDSSYKVEHREAIKSKIVIFSDALSVMQALSNPQNKELTVTASAVSVLLNANGKTVLQWIPAHCNIPGTRKWTYWQRRGQQDQEERDGTYKEVKTIGYHKGRRDGCNSIPATTLMKTCTSSPEKTMW